MSLLKAFYVPSNAHRLSMNWNKLHFLTCSSRLGASS